MAPCSRDVSGSLPRLLGCPAETMHSCSLKGVCSPGGAACTCSGTQEGLLEERQAGGCSLQLPHSLRTRAMVIKLSKERPGCLHLQCQLQGADQIAWERPNWQADALKDAWWPCAGGRVSHLHHT